MAFTNEEKQILSNYVTNVEGNVFALVNLPEVVKGALFSRYSRSSKSLKRLLLDEFLASYEVKGIQGGVDIKKAEEFYERVLIGFGDDSVAELAFAHIALENISNIAAKAVEDNRIGISPLEKSSRYVYFDQKIDDRYLYYTDDFLNQFSKYAKTMDFLFDTYSQLIPKLRSYFEEKFPKEENVSERAYKSAIRAKVCDTIRGLLPASTLTNVGLAGNGRAFEYLILKLRSSELSELKGLAKNIHEELQKVLPVFVKRAFMKHGDMFVEYLNNEKSLFSRFQNYSSSNEKEVELLSVKGTENEVLAGIVFMYSGLSYKKSLELINKMNEEEKKELIKAYFAIRENRRHKPNRAFELASFTFQITANFGAYRDLQRHRILTQFRQLLNVNLGFDVPEEIKEIGYEDLWNEAMYKAADAYYEIAEVNKEYAQYAVPFAYRVRWLMHLNLREAFHLCELRSSEQGHPDYRKIAIEISKQIKQHFPLLGEMKYLNTKHIALERLNSEIKIDKKIKEIKEKYGKVIGEQER